MLGTWISLSVSKLPELKDNLTGLRFDWAPQLVTAIALVAGGYGLLANIRWGQPVCLLAMGMLLYTVVASPAYYLQKRE
jgi:hypothetical protein